MKKTEKLEREKAVSLSRALTSQLGRRLSAIESEVATALGAKVRKTVSPKPPKWALHAIRRVLGIDGKASLLNGIGMDSCAWGASEWGKVLGMTGTWGAILANSTPTTLNLEKKVSELTDFRNQFATMLEPFFTKIAVAGVTAGNEVHKASGIDHLNFSTAYSKSAGAIISKKGEPLENETTTQTICFFLWLYWPELKYFETMTQLRVFFAEFCQEDVKQKNLEKVCRDIGLKFKARGAPAKKFLLQGKSK